MANRQSRRAAVSKRGKSAMVKSNGHGGAKSVQLTQAQKDLLMQKRSELMSLKAEIADLEDLKGQKLVTKRQKERELNTLVANSLQAHGIDLSKPGAGRYEIDLDSMSVTHIEAPKEATPAE